MKSSDQDKQNDSAVNSQEREPKNSRYCPKGDRDANTIAFDADPTYAGNV